MRTLSKVFSPVKSFLTIAVLLFLCTLIACAPAVSDQELKQRYDKAIASKNWKAVIDILDVLIERHPEAIENYYSRAIAKTNINPKDPEGVIEDLSVFISQDSVNYKARYIRFQAYSVLGQYDKALVDIDKIIELKGKTAFLLAWKGNCAFAAKKFDVSEQVYEERLRLPGAYDDLKNTYYYWVLSKYFNSNKEGALWDIAFLEKRGFKTDDALMQMIADDQVSFDEVSSFQLPQLTLGQLDDMLNNFCSDFDIFQSEIYFRPQILRQIYDLEKTKDLQSLLLNKSDVFALNISNSSLSELPEELSQFINLQVLDISGNRFKDKEKLFEDLSKLPNLRILFADLCSLRALPDNINLLKNLEVLSLEANGLKVINEHLGELTKLKYLSLRGNSYLKDLPQSIGNLRCLQFLNVSGGGMTRLRDELSNCSELVTILANASKIETLPNQIGNLINLKHLNLAANKIEIIPNSIGQLSELNHLSLGSNEISKLPKEIANLNKLQFLGLDFNRFKTFPSQTLQLESVVNLWVHNNSFKSIPPSVGNMESLTHLLVDHQIISDENIEAIKKVNPALRVIREDSREYTTGPKRKN